MKGSLIIVSFFALGVLCGVFHWLPVEWFSGNLSFYALCALMFSVGLSIGHDGRIVWDPSAQGSVPVATISIHL